MSMPQELFLRVSRQAWWKSFPFLLALLVLVFMGWVTARVVVYPDDGISSFNESGVIEGIRESGPADGLLQIHDRIIEIDGKKWEQVLASYEDVSGGEEVVYKIQREGQTHDILLTIHQADNQKNILNQDPIQIATRFK